ADHLPIHTILSIVFQHTQCEPPWNFCNVDWEKFEMTLRTALGTTLSYTPDTSEALDKYVHKLMLAIQHTICKHIPQS
ncbi:hypothetical protein M422DRAFT_181266, partial [Sphaerobolus stellatus SS14]